MAKKTTTPKPSDAEQVAQYLDALVHPMKKEIEALRSIIKNSNTKLSERIKWNAPSYYYIEDILTFGPLARKQDEILLVFHHPFIVHIQSEILKGDYKDRRLAYFYNMAEVKKYEQEISGIVNEIITEIDSRPQKVI